jgi:hypothetical protein
LRSQIPEEAVRAKLLAATLCLALLIPAFRANAFPRTGWDAVGRIPHSERVTVHLRSGEFTGYIREVDLEGLSLELRTITVRIRREAIVSISKSSHWSGALVGALVVGGIGAIIGATRPQVISRGSFSSNERLGGATATAALLGTVGAAVGFTVGRQQIIYLAPLETQPAASLHSPPAIPVPSRR